MLRLAIVLVALAILFSLTALALWSNEQLRHPYLTAAALAATLAAGIALLAIL